MQIHTRVGTWLTLGAALVCCPALLAPALGQVCRQGKPGSAPQQPEAMVRNLYKEVVARHPASIPDEAAIRAFLPYISKSLLHRIDLAATCGKDWRQQNPDRNLKPELAWLEMGLFTGANEKTSPRTFRVEETQPDKDGSLRVHVRLTYGRPPEQYVWRVAAIVVEEGERVAIDDVIFLKDEVTGEDEYRLSETLASGCDGPRWVGYGKPQGDSAVGAQGAAWYQTDFPAEEFRARWEKVFAGIGGEAVALLQGVPLTNGFIFPRQHNDFYYLCGIETPQSYLLLDGRTKKATLFLPPRNPRLEAAEGKVLSAEDADVVKRLTGVDEVLSTDAMRGDWLGAGRNSPRAIYAQFAPQEGAAQSRYELQAADAAIAGDYWDGRLPRQLHFIELLRARFPRADIRNLTPIIDEMRSVKSPREIALIRRASELAGLAIIEAMRSTRPGVKEYELDAVGRYVYLVNGAKLEGYRSIVAAGTPNIWNMHYYRNNAELRSGDLILYDYSPEVSYYVSDVTRMWPVNGKFEPWQRELVGFVLEYRNAIIERIRPGVTAMQVREEAKKAMEAVFARWKFSKPVYEQAARRLVETGGGVFSHPVGLTVHDDGGYLRKPLQPGHVFSIDPQLRVPEENLYIRYEDVVVVTEKGVENFTDFLPSELDDIEKLVGKNGMLQKSPPNPGKPVKP